MYIDQTSYHCTVIVKQNSKHMKDISKLDCLGHKLSNVSDLLEMLTSLSMRIPSLLMSCTC